MEAGGVEPPSEKRYDTKTTCLALFGVRPDPCEPAARSPPALRTSKKRGRLVRLVSPGAPDRNALASLLCDVSIQARRRSSRRRVLI